MPLLPSGPWTRTRRVSFAFLALSFLLFSSGVVLVVVSQVWRAETQEGKQMGGGTLRAMVLRGIDLTATTILGTTLMSILVPGLLGYVQGYRPGSLQRREAKGLILFSWSLVAVMVATLAVASTEWFFTLREVDDFRRMWEAADGGTQMFLQDKHNCCGFFNASSAGLLTQPSGFCAPFATPGGNATSVQGCETPMLAFGDWFLNNVFTTIYGFTSIQFALFLTTLCLITSRRDDERVRLAWEKNGGRGFV
ncbi:hypothetical protein JCM8547_006677 [Rhodosporidiobolus lusitaniae]